MPACVSLETQISSVMESLTRAAVSEICKLINSECVEMRLEIRRGQKEIEALKGKIRDLKREAQNPPLVEPRPGLLDGDNRVDDLSTASDCQNEERDKKTNTPAPVKNLQDQASRNYLPNSGSKRNQMLFSPSESGVQLKESQFVIDTLTTEAIAEISGLNTATVKVEGVSPPVSTAECVSEVYRPADHKQFTNAQNHRAGENSNHFGSAEELWPQSHYSAHFHNKHLSGEDSNYKYDLDFNHTNGQRSNEGNPSRLLLKTEENEEPLTKTTNELAPCGLMDSTALSWPSLTSVNFPVSGGGPGCSSMLQGIHASHSEHPAFHLSVTGEIEYTTESEAKQAGGRNIQDMIQSTALGQNSTVSTMLTKAKVLPIADMRHKLFVCSFCPKSFQSGADLKRHQRIHTGEKPYGCAVCGKRFSLRGNLVTHERAHSGSKPFICRHCGRAFAHGSNLRAHQRVHTGERPFHCSLCDKTFAWYYPFKRHLSLHFLNGQNS